jgi:hypothetical protein
MSGKTKGEVAFQIVFWCSIPMLTGYALQKYTLKKVPALDEVCADVLHT